MSGDELDFAGSRSAHQAILAAVDALRNGRGGRLHVVAARGAGLTTVLRRAQEHAAAADIDVDVVESRSGHISFLRLAGLAATRRPLLICVDAREGRHDVEESTLSLAPRTIGDRPVLWVIGAERFSSDEVPPARIEALGIEEIQSLARVASSAAVLPTNLLAAVSNCPPLPRAVVETVARWQRDPTLAADRLVWPDGLLQDLTDPDRAYLERAAQASDPIDPEDWARSIDVGLGRLIPTVVRGLDAGVLRECGSRLVFAHPLVRRSFLAAGSRPGSEDVGPTGTGATGAGRLTEAREIRRRLGSGAGPDEGALRARALSCEADAGVVSHSQLKEWVHLEVPDVAIALLTTQLLFAYDLAPEVFDWALSARISPESRRSVEAARAVRSVLIHPDDSVRWESIFMSVPEDRVPEVALLVHLARGLGEAERGRLRSALRHISRAAELALDRTPGPIWWTARILRARILADLGRGRESLRIADDSLQLADQVGDLAATRALLTLRGGQLVEHGRLDDANRSLKLAVNLGQALGSPDGLEGNPRLMLARIAHLRADRAATAVQHVADAVAGADESGRSALDEAISRLSEEPTLDPPTAARSLAEAISSASGGRAYPIVRSVTDELIRIRLFLRAGQAENAREVWRNLRRLASEEPSTLITAAARHADGILHRRPTPIASALLTYEQLELPILAALAAEDRADVGGEGDLIPGLREARSIWASLGAIRETARIDRRLREHGARAVDTSEPVLALGLTRAEEKIALHVGAGLTNRAIAAALSLSPNTVGAHLRRVYAKTGATDRASLIELIQSHSS